MTLVHEDTGIVLSVREARAEGGGDLPRHSLEGGKDDGVRSR